MQHDRPVPGAVLADIFGIQAFRQVGIDLQRAALPVTADGVAQHEFQLRAIEGALAGVQFEFNAGDGAGFAQRALGLIPEFIAADAGFRPVAELDAELGEAEVAVDAGQQLDEFGGFRRDLVRGAENMRIVLGERPHPHDAVQRAGRLIAVARPEFRHAQRQLAVRPHAVPEDLHMAGAVHRL